MPASDGASVRGIQASPAPRSSAGQTTVFGRPEGQDRWQCVGCFYRTWPFNFFIAPANGKLVSISRMLIFPRERVGLFIDGMNLHTTSRALGFGIDFKRLLHLFRQQSQLLRALYYTTLIDDDGPNPLRPLIDWLEYNGYTTITKPARQHRDGENWQPGARSTSSLRSTRCGCGAS